jgi:hypothetical protein
VPAFLSDSRIGHFPKWLTFDVLKNSKKLIFGSQMDHHGEYWFPRELGSAWRRCANIVAWDLGKRYHEGAWNELFTERASQNQLPETERSRASSQCYGRRTRQRV